MTTYSADSDESILPREILVECGFSTDEADALEAHLRRETCGEYTQDTFWAFAVAEGIYYYGEQYTDGQGSRAYRMLCTVQGSAIEFSPGRFASFERFETDEHHEHEHARLVFDWLAEHFGLSEIIT